MPSVVTVIIIVYIETVTLLVATLSQLSAENKFANIFEIVKIKIKIIIKITTIAGQFIIALELAYYNCRICKVSRIFGGWLAIAKPIKHSVWI